ncbi:hypothetical protein NPX13_g8571 [Xylaria arbuscula]|uniref:Uncharacterized protein n=1 Tax=Xylaria arbuscula TaxID=114810 RepID=A0A9W8TI86_9PEZI|nr:hypothetical protein NPX13_g8571 [Xylaria arbuscula]
MGRDTEVFNEISRRYRALEAQFSTFQAQWRQVSYDGLRQMEYIFQSEFDWAKEKKDSVTDEGQLASIDTMILRYEEWRNFARDCITAPR